MIKVVNVEFLFMEIQTREENHLLDIININFLIMREKRWSVRKFPVVLITNT